MPPRPLTNVIKHGGPVPTTVVVRYRPSDVELEIVDEGAGTAVAPTAAGVGHGLVGMRERVALFGGSLDVGPRPGGGWSVNARLPLGAEPR